MLERIFDSNHDNRLHILIKPWPWIGGQIKVGLKACTLCTAPLIAEFSHESHLGVEEKVQ